MTRFATPMLFSALAAALLTATLAECSGVESAGSQEDGVVIENSELNDVIHRFSSMTHVVGDPKGDTAVDAAEAGTLWALTRRDDVDKTTRDACLIDGAQMAEPSESLNIPEPDNLGAEGPSQTLFTFAQGTIPAAGTYTVTCALDAPALLFLFEPSSEPTT